MTEKRYANRSRARVAVFQMLYQEDLNPGSDRKLTEGYLREELPDESELLEFARTLIVETREQREEMDRQIEGVAQNWSVSRMSVVDRNILRLAICEMNVFGTPKPVVINEAVELAKQFGAKDSPGFVNGILDKIDR
ncbi:MAG: transcription antitermination factor NusB [Thermoguttaceae bacterium]